MDNVSCYIDDIGIWSDDWEHHKKLVNEVLCCLQENGFTVTPLKCEWAVQETDWLGYWLTPTGLKPWRKKIDAILRISAPKTKTELCDFIGGITYYRDMWHKCAHILAPLIS